MNIVLSLSEVAVLAYTLQAYLDTNAEVLDDQEKTDLTLLMETLKTQGVVFNG